MPATVTRRYQPQFALKYGCNPHQAPAGVFSLEDGPLPFQVLNGQPGYINLLDALNAWQLVWELRQALQLPAAASFKHVSPAGAALAVPLSPELAKVYEVDAPALTPQALAWVRARQADPMSSFGDFAALSDPIDEATALLIKGEVSDGLIAPGYSPQALEILKQKKGGKFIVLQADPAFTPPADEYKEVFGVALMQQRNQTLLTTGHLAQRPTTKQDLSPQALRDLVLAAITLKYTQSNSVGYALDGQMIGVGAGQQNRVDCVRLAGEKATLWALRQHPLVQALPFAASVKRVDRTNARVRYIQGDFTAQEHAAWLKHFTQVPQPLTAQDKQDWLQRLSGVSLASDAFFPFRDSIDRAAGYGVSYVVQPGGSVADNEVIQACNEYGMIMAFTGVRLFHH